MIIQHLLDKWMLYIDFCLDMFHRFPKFIWWEQTTGNGNYCTYTVI